MIEGFRLRRRMAVPELALEGMELEEPHTGATVIHLTHSSPAAFSIAFRTPPRDSTGLPHVLEHTALCGSRDFPVRDPFFRMLTRSLAVYMNAWTASDYTQYPFVTENADDYRNLRRVYMDAVLHPTLAYDDFRQEGWRWEPVEGAGKEASAETRTKTETRTETETETETENPSSSAHPHSPSLTPPVKLAGVVFNEMKGALGDADGLFLTRLQQARFCDTSPHAFVSGGDPLHIPHSTHDDLVAFHRHHYHPSNALVTTTGSETHLHETLAMLGPLFRQFANRRQEFSAPHGDDKHVPASPKRVEIAGPVDPYGDPQRQTRMLVSFLVEDPGNLQEAFNLRLLAHLLFEGPSAPFHRALLVDAKLGGEYAPGTGYDGSTTPATLAVGLQGLTETDVSVTEALIDRIFRDIRADIPAHFSPRRIETALHQIQLGLRHTSANFGLSLVSTVTQAWARGADPLASLAIDCHVAQFRKQLAAGGLFETLLDRHVLHNPTRLVFVMRPDRNYATDLVKQEAALVAAHSAHLSATDMANIQEESRRLREKQDAPQDLSCLPCLTVDQVAPTIRDASLPVVSNGNGDGARIDRRIDRRIDNTHTNKRIENQSTSENPPQCRLYEGTCPETNGLVYFKARLPLDCASLSERELLLLPLLTQCLEGLGSRALGPVEFDLSVKQFTGGLSASLHQGRVMHPSHVAPLSLLLSSFALRENGPRMLELLKAALLDTNFDDGDQLRSTLSAAALAINNSIASSGNHFAALRAAALLPSPRARIAELLGGLSQAQFLNRLQEESSLEDLAVELRTLRDRLLVAEWRAAVMRPDGHDGAWNAALVEFFSAVKAAVAVGVTGDSQQTNSNSNGNGNNETATPRVLFVPGAYGTNFCAQAFMPLGGQRRPTALEAAALILSARLLRAKHLHREVREKGGAYGASASYSPLSGLFTLSSYRDPNPQRTLAVFADAAGELLRSDRITEQDLVETKLATFSALDAPVDLSSRGLSAFLYEEEEVDDGDSSLSEDERRQELRDALRGCTMQQLRAAISDILMPAQKHDARTCVIGEAEQMDACQATNGTAIEST